MTDRAGTVKDNRFQPEDIREVVGQTRDKIQALYEVASKGNDPDWVVRSRFETPLGPVAIEGNRAELKRVLGPLEEALGNGQEMGRRCDKLSRGLDPDDGLWFQRVMSEFVEHWGVSMEHLGRGEVTGGGAKKKVDEKLAGIRRQRVRHLRGILSPGGLAPEERALILEHTPGVVRLVEDETWAHVDDYYLTGEGYEKLEAEVSKFGKVQPGEIDIKYIEEALPLAEDRRGHGGLTIPKPPEKGEDFISPMDGYTLLVKTAAKVMDRHARGEAASPGDLEIAESILQFDSTLYEFDAKIFPPVSMVKELVGRGLVTADVFQKGRHFRSLPAGDRINFSIALSIIRRRYPLHFLSPEIIEIIENTDLVDGEDDVWDLEELPLPFDSMCIMLPRGTRIGGEGCDMVSFTRESAEGGEALEDELSIVVKLAGSNGLRIGSGTIISERIGILNLAPPAPVDPRDMTYGGTALDERGYEQVNAIIPFIYKLVTILDVAPDLITPERVIRSLKNKKNKSRGGAKRLLVAPRYIGKDFVERKVTHGQPGSGTHASPRIHWRKRFIRSQRHGHPWEARNGESDNPKTAYTGVEADGTTYRYHKVLIDKKLVNAKRGDGENSDTK